MPATHLVSTVLPAPLSPHSAVTWPDGRSRLTWYRACTGPKCLSRSWTRNSGWSVALVLATAAVIGASLSPCRKSDAAARCGGVENQVGGYEIPAAVHTAAVTLAHRAALSTKLSLITVSFMLALVTQIGTRREAGCSLPVTPDGGV